MENTRSDFSQWYNEIIELAELMDKRYPIKGMNVWLPYGYSLMRNIDEMIRERFYADDFREVMFPALISRGMFEIEFEHIKGFENELFWVTKGGKESFEDDLAMRPTSEAAIYPMFKLWIRDHMDLPMRIFQIVQVWRYETKHTRPFIRVRDIHFIECHTAHSSYEDAEEQLEIYRKQWNFFTDALCLPFMEIQRPEWDKFPGAVYTRAFDTIMPSGRTIQIGTIHQYGQNFSKNYDVKYADMDGNAQYAYQTTFGMSERLVAHLISIHGDDKGLILPPAVAPYQVVIVPIPGTEPNLKSYIDEITNFLKDSDIRFTVDFRENYTPGYKYNHWEMKGVPLRFEIGDREVKNRTITAAFRTGRKKEIMKFTEINKVNDMLNSLADELREKAHKVLREALSGKILGEPEDAIKTPVLCNDEKCARHLEEKLSLTLMGHIMNHVESGKCEVCGKDGQTALFSRPY